MPGVITYGMNDVGRRIDFLMELQDLWSGGLAIATQGYMTKSDKEMAAKLEVALELLTNHLRNDFDIRSYVQEINNLPEPKRIKSTYRPSPGESNYGEDEDEPGFFSSTGW